MHGTHQLHRRTVSVYVQHVCAVVKYCWYQHDSMPCMWERLLCLFDKATPTLGLSVAGAVSRGASEAVNSRLATFASVIALVVGAGVLLSGWGVALPFSFSLM